MRNAGILVVVALVACESKHENQEARRESPSREAPHANMTGPKHRKMANCPSAIPGAKTVVEKTPDGVDVTITANDSETSREIVELAKLHARAANRPAVFVEHSGRHGGPATVGYCPSVHANTTVTVTPVTGGVRLAIKPISSRDVETLQKTAMARAERLPGFTSS